LPIVTAESWDEALTHLPQAEKVLVGQRVAGFSEALAWVRDSLPPSTDCVLWMDQTTAAAGEFDGCAGVHIWRGEIDQPMLEAWWSHADPGVLVGERQWAVVSLPPYPGPGPLIGSLSDAARSQFGDGGGWVDLDWQRAELSLALAQDLYDRPDYPFGSLRTRGSRKSRIVPAPPPWIPGTRRPNDEQILQLLGLPWPLQGWYLGADIGSQAAMAVLERVPAVVLWQDAKTAPHVTRQTEEYLRTICKAARLLVAIHDQVNAGWNGRAPASARDSSVPRGIAKIFGRRRTT
jgi:hypothetical protein